MMAFSSALRPAFRSVELKRIHALMLEKGIRLHHPLSEYITDWQSEASENEGDVEHEDPGLMQTEDDKYASREADDRLRLLPM